MSLTRLLSTGVGSSLSRPEGSRPVGAMVSGATAVFVAAGPGFIAPGHASPGGPGAPTQDFEITADVGGIYPGVETTLDAEVTNPQDFTIRVTEVEVSVEDANPGCPASLLHIGELEQPVDVDPGATGLVPLPLELDFEAPEACRNAVWALTLHATAVEADGLPPTSTTEPSGTTPSSTSTSEPGQEGPDSDDDQDGQPPSAEPPSDSGGEGVLPTTGVGIATMVGLALLLIALGAGAWHVAYRRRCA